MPIVHLSPLLRFVSSLFPCVHSSKPSAYVSCSCSALFWQRFSIFFEQVSVASAGAPPWFKCSLVYRHCSLFTFVNEFELLQVLLKLWQPHRSQVSHDWGDYGAQRALQNFTPADIWNTNAKSWSPWHHRLDETRMKQKSSI